MDAFCTTPAELPAELRRRAEARCAGFMPPPITELPDLDRAELYELIHESSGLFEQLEGGIMTAASIHGAFDLAIAEGLLVLTQGDRLLQLGVRAGAYRLQGFAIFRHYVAERLGLSPRAIEQRVALEGRIRESAALRRAREEQLSLERLRALAHLRLDDVALATWIPRARELSVIALRYALESPSASPRAAPGRIPATSPASARSITTPFTTGT